MLLVSDYGKCSKNVAFEVNRSTPFIMPTPSSYPALSVSPGLVPKSILHKQGTHSPKLISKNSGTIKNLKRPSSLNTGAKTKSLDLIHDDWFGLAPLASPESLSEISSISSRTSNVISLAASIEKCLQRITLQDNTEITEIDESQLQTPKVLRRAPKISGNLSTCADDWRSVDSYKRMGKIFVTGHFVPSYNNSDSSDLSYETASSLSRNFITTNELDARFLEHQSKSVDNLDDNTIQILDKFKQTNSESRILSECHSSCPNCPCSNSSSIECCRLHDHSKCLPYKRSYYNNNATAPNATAITNSSSEDTYYSAMSSLTGFESSNSNSLQIQSTKYIPEECSTINSKTGLLESHFPAYLINDDRLSLLQSTSSSLSNDSPKINNSKRNGKRINFIQTSCTVNSKKRNNSNDKIFSKNESLPLLTNLSEKSSPTNYVKRKRNVYPMTTPINRTERLAPMLTSEIIKGESHV